MSEETLISGLPQPEVANHPADSLSYINLSQIHELLSAGGPVILILGLMSIVAMTVFLAKSWQFFWLRLNRHKPIYQALGEWHEHSTEKAINTLGKSPSPLARVLERAMTLRSNHAIGESVAREEVLRIAKRQLVSARSHLKILEVIATLSPLLGLLGTVLGMIEAFQKLQGAGSTIDPSILSGGIWEALLTTAAGLIVAIPTVLGLHWLEQQVERFKATMEDAITQVFTTEANQPKASIVSNLNVKELKKDLPNTKMVDPELAAAE